MDGPADTQACFTNLGDQAVLAYFPDESAAMRFAGLVRRDNPGWLVDVVQAYTSVAVFFDLDRIHFKETAEYLRRLNLRGQDAGSALPESPLHRIPCCYGYQLDLERVARHIGLGEDEVIRLHAD